MGSDVSMCIEGKNTGLWSSPSTYSLSRAIGISLSRIPALIKASILLSRFKRRSKEMKS
jgi:hypothetical protein